MCVGGWLGPVGILLYLQKTEKFVSKNTWTINISVRAANYIDQVYTRCTRSAPSWYTYFLTLDPEIPML